MMLEEKGRKSNEQQYMKMTTAPVGKLIARLAVPTMISMLVTAVYNMADTYFVSQLGTSAAGAVGIVFSLMALIQAVGFTLGMGAGSNISRLLGAQKEERAQEIASTAFYSSVFFGLMLSVLGLTHTSGLMRLLGATRTILPYAIDYASFILIGAPVMCGSFVLNNVLRAEGRAAFSMIGISFGGILNMILDPIFIYSFRLGITGAAIATVLSQFISFLILLSCFLRRKTIIRLDIRRMAKEAGTYLLIIKTGLPSLFRQGLASIATVMLNVNAAVYGDAAVAAMSIVGKCFMLIFSSIIGFGQGFQPVVGYNYGAKKYARVREAFRFSLTVGIAMLFVLSVAGFLLAPQIMMLFRRDDPEVIAIGTFALRSQCISLAVMPVSVMTNMLFQSIGKYWTATLLSSARQGIFFLPLIAVLPELLGLAGVQITQMCADFLTVLCCLPFLIGFFRNLKELEGEKETCP